MERLVEIYLDRPSTRMGTGLFCRDGVARPVVPAIHTKLNDHGKPNERRSIDCDGGWLAKLRFYPLVGKITLDCRVTDWIDGDATEPNVRPGRFQSSVDGRDMEFKSQGAIGMASEPGPMDLL